MGIFPALTTADATGSPAAAGKEALRIRLGRLRDGNKLLRERNDLLRQANRRLREMVERLARTRGELAQTIHRLREANATLRTGNAGLKERLALAAAERRCDRRGDKLAPLEHNTPDGMDRFYAENANLERLEDAVHRQFALALRGVLDAAGIVLDGRRVADFGCGTGHALRCLLAGAAPASVTGFDYAESGLRVARTLLPEARFVRHDIDQPVGQEFDVVLCSETLEHLRRPDRGLLTLLRAIAPGGVALLSVPDGRSDVSLSHINFWSPESWSVFIETTLAALAGEGHGLVPETGLLEPELARIRYNYALIRRVG